MRLRAMTVVFFASFVLTLFTISCGGGGGGGGGDHDDKTHYTPLEYTGLTDAAVITTRNAKQIVHNLFGEMLSSDTTSKTVKGLPAGDLPTTDLVNGLHWLVSLKPMQRHRSGEKADMIDGVAVNDTQSCPLAGTATYKGNVNGDGTGTLDVVYRNCDDGEMVQDGSFRYQVIAYDERYGIETNAKMTRIHLHVIRPDGSMTMGGSIHRIIDIGNKTEQTSGDLIIRQEDTGIEVKSVDYAEIKTFDTFPYPNSYTMTAQGRMYDSRFGYVDVQTLSPMTYQTMDQKYCDAGASLLFTGADDATILAMVLADNVLHIELDLNADDRSEWVARVPWAGLASEGTNEYPPTVDAGVDQRMRYLKTVVLEGTKSRDADDDFLQYTWTIVESPGASSAALSDADRPVATFVPDAVGDYLIRLTVSDGLHESSDEIVLTALEKDPQDMLQAWHTHQGNFSHNGYMPLHLNSADFSERWSITLVDGIPLGSVAADDNRIFVAPDNYQPGYRKLFVISAMDGKVRLEKDFGNIQYVDPPAYANGYIYLQTHATDGSFLWALKGSDVSLVFRVALNGYNRPFLAPTPYNGKLYFSENGYGHLYSYDGLDGSRIWSASLGMNDFKYTPAVDQAFVYHYVDGKVSQLNRLTGEVLNVITHADAGTYDSLMDRAPVLGHHNNVIVIHDNRLVNYDFNDLSIGWQVSSSFTGQPALSEDVVYAINAGTIQARTETDGTLLWSWEPPDNGTITGNIIVTQTHLFAATDEITYAVDLTTHTQVWQYAASGYLALSDEGALLIAANNGRLIAIDVEGDGDGDGLPTWWERQYGLNDRDASDAVADADGDGLDALAEYGAQTDPDAADSDMDGVSDSDEVNVYETDPIDRDTDNDLLLDGEEIYTHATNPLAVDSDADGLDDAAEIEVYQSNPNSADSDGDSMDDLWETVHTMDPNADDSGLDADGDNLTNLEEFTLATDPNAADTDNDGLSDGNEVNHTGTDPLLVDTDGDVLNDALELAQALDPLDGTDAGMDADGDGFSNLSEIFNATNHRDSSSAPAATQWRTHQGNAAHNGYVPFIVDPTALNELWVADLGIRSQLFPAVAGDGKVFVTIGVYGQEHALFVLNAASGTMLWKYEFNNIYFVSPPVYADGRVVVQTDDYASDASLLAFDATDATAAFKVSEKYNWVQSFPATPYAGFVYTRARSADDYILCTDATDGTEIWRIQLKNAIQDTPTVAHDKIYLYTTLGIRVYDRVSGSDLYLIPDPDYGWTDTRIGMITAIGNVQNLIAVQAQRLISFDLNRRQIGWQITSDFQGPFAVGPGVIYAINNGGLEARKETDGDLLWGWTAPDQNQLTSNIVVAENILFVSSADTTYAVDLTSHAAIWTYPAGGHLTLGNEGQLFIASADGYLYGISVDQNTDEPQ